MSNTTKSPTAKALMSLTPVSAKDIPTARRGRPVGTGPWNDLANQALAAPGQTFQYPEPVAPGTAQYLRKRYGLDITTRQSDTPKRVNMFITAPVPVKAKARKPRKSNPDASTSTGSMNLPIVDA